MSCSNWNLFMLLAISHVAVALFSYYCFSFYNYRHDDQQLAELSLQTTKLDAVVFDVRAPGTYDFFYFVLQWPGSYTPRKQDVPNNFTIHGLWPNYWNGTWLINCQGSNFSKDKIKLLVQDLNMHWPSLSNKTKDEDFWEYEWRKHGTCSEAVLDQFKYFEAALRLKGSLDILQTLQINGVSPSATRKYRTTNITEILKRQYNKAPRIKCNQNGSDYQLLEIHLCVDRTGANLTDCRKKTSLNCSEEIKFPPISR